MPVDRRGWPTLRALANLLNCHRLSVNSLQHLKMPKSNTNFPYVSSSNPPGNLFMDSNQLVDSLTAHISLYHNRSPSSSPNPNPNPRSSILKWSHLSLSSSASLTFQRGEESGLGSDWVELEWLKAKGYYSIESFVANRLEVALRLAWFNCGNNGKKRGVKLKEKVNVAGIAANVFWRKKGCIDWWQNLDCAMRRKMIIVVLGKAAKSLTDEILKGAYSALEDEKWLFNAGGGQPVKYKYTASSQRTDQALSDDAEAGSIMIPSFCLWKTQVLF
ncbi:hypothetical protein CK203_029956 [Vitis vinifera]|uniref:Uncharacterized protein n=1 Tax=Vitis vinifera TaxID=29760 RepID=A0A438IKG7_VITVI|nr:hypothetical protein CK203_029956 [Vitis vinifera]